MSVPPISVSTNNNSSISPNNRSHDSSEPSKVNDRVCDLFKLDKEVKARLVFIREIEELNKREKAGISPVGLARDEANMDKAMKIAKKSSELTTKESKEKRDRALYDLGVKSGIVPPADDDDDIYN